MQSTRSIAEFVRKRFESIVTPNGLDKSKLRKFIVETYKFDLPTHGTAVLYMLSEIDKLPHRERDEARRTWEEFKQPTIPRPKIKDIFDIVLPHLEAAEAKLKKFDKTDYQ